MKKKYSTLLNFALCACLATTLAACGSDGDKTGSTGQNKKGPKIDIGGTVMDTNGIAIQGARVSVQGESTTTNAAGQYYFKKLLVSNVAGADDSTSHGPVRVVIQPPDNYLGAVVSVYPEAQIDGSVDPDLDGSSGGSGGSGFGGDNNNNTGGAGGNGVWWDGGDGGSAGGNDGGAGTGGDGGDGGDGGSYTVVNPRTTFIDGMYVEAATAMLPMLSSDVTGVLRDCDTGAAIGGATVRLDMWAVDNNDPVLQADNDCDSGCYFSYEANPHASVTGDDGSFSFTNVPNDSILRMWAPGYDGLAVEDSTAGDVSCSPGSTPSNSEGDCIATTNEGLLYLGDVCVDPIPTNDNIQPCVTSVTGAVTRTSADWEGNSDLYFAALHDNLHGLTGFEINFTETLQDVSLNANSIVIWDAGVDPDDTDDDVDYITDFTAEISGSTLTITTAEAVPDDHHLVVYLLKSDHRDLSGNFLTHDDETGATVCNSTSSSGKVAPDALFYTDPYSSTNGSGYIQVGIKVYSEDQTNADAVTELKQECTDYSVTVANQTDLQTEYPTVFRSEWDDSGGNTFYNLNADAQYETRLEGLADQLVCPNDITENAQITNNYATVSFLPPVVGDWQIGSSSDADCQDNCSGSGESGTQYVVVGSDSSDNDLAANIGDTIYVESIDDFSNISAVVEVVLGDCVAPTTVLNYGYNTCGYATNRATPAFTNLAGQLCIDADVDTLFDFGDGAENAGVGEPGECGVPTLNITCRLLKDPEDAANLDVVEPITLYRLQDGDNARTGSDYDATSFSIWQPFNDTIGVAFSENIDMTTDGTIDWAGITSITSWTLANNVGKTDDNDTPDGGSANAQADLVMISVDDVITLANDDHRQIMNFSNAVEDLAGHPADKAQVVVNDLIPPFVEYALWSEDGLVIKFNEPVDVDTSSTSVDCDVALGAPIALATDFVTLENLAGPGTADIYANCATLEEDGTLLTIPQGNLTGITRSDYFPADFNDTAAIIYSESTYVDLGFAPSVDDGSGVNGFAHGVLNWDTIEDELGNRWLDWDAAGDGLNTRGGAADDFVDSGNGALCITPDFGIVDVLGPFNTTVIGVVANFADGEPASCITGTEGPYSMVLNYSFSHPLDLEASFPGATCANTDACTVAEVNSYLDAAWVDLNVAYNGTAIGDVTIPELSGVSGVLADSRQSLAVTISNGLGTTDCTTFTGGLTPDSLGSAWTVFSAYEVGNPKQLGTYTASGP